MCMLCIYIPSFRPIGTPMTNCISYTRLIKIEINMPVISPKTVHKLRLAPKKNYGVEVPVIFEREHKVMSSRLKVVWGDRTKWYWTKWHRQNGTDKMARTKW